MYQIKSSVDLDKAELLLYEEVTRMPPFRRKTLVLVGSEGVGRRTLKNRLINSDPDRFGTTMPRQLFQILTNIFFPILILLTWFMVICMLIWTFDLIDNFFINLDLGLIDWWFQIMIDFFSRLMNRYFEANAWAWRRWNGLLVRGTRWDGARHARPPIPWVRRAQWPLVRNQTG